jgi:hypothetical protein
MFSGAVANNHFNEDSFNEDEDDEQQQQHH